MVPKYRNPFVSSIFSHFQLSGVIRNGSTQDDGKIMQQNQLNRLQMVQFECPEYRNPSVASIFGGIPFSHIQLWANKKWEPQYKDQDGGNFMEQNQLNRLQMVQFKI